MFPIGRLKGVAVATQIFLDDLILYNLLMNGLLLAVTAYLLRETTKGWRLLMGAGLGSLYLITFFIPGLRALTSVLVRLACPIPMVWLAFPNRHPVQLLRLCGTFYLVSMAAGGVSLGFYYLSRTTPWWYRGLTTLRGLPSWLPLAGVMVLFWLMRWFVMMTRPLWRRVGREYLVRITLDGQTITVKALLDNGNELRDPVSGRPVMIVDHRQLTMLSIPPTYAGSDHDVCALAEQFAETALADRIHLVPYRTVGRSSGILLALRPESIAVLADDGERLMTQLLVGIGHHLAPSGQSYQALLPSAAADVLSSPGTPQAASHAT